MQVQVTGKNLSIGDALKARIEARLGAGIARLFDAAVSAHVTVEKQKNIFRCECVLHLPTGVVLQARDENADAYQGFEAAAHHLETQLRRYKSRLRGHERDRHAAEARAAQSYVLAPIAEEEDAAAPLDAKGAPAIIAETRINIPVLSVADAAMQLDISGLAFVGFHEAATGRFNIVFRREDGNIGWIDPRPEKTKHHAIQRFSLTRQCFAHAQGGQQEADPAGACRPCRQEGRARPAPHS